MAFNYEPGSVMKVLTVAAAIDCGFAGPGTTYGTNRDDPDYYRLPGDGSHVWDPTMTLRDAIVHSSNIVIGKLGYNLGPKRLFTYFKRFGLGEKTGIELPGEQYGILPDPNKRMWDMASWSRAAIGQFVAVTGIQLIGAYQAIANDGMRMKPYKRPSRKVMKKRLPRRLHPGAGKIKPIQARANTRVPGDLLSNRRRATTRTLSTGVRSIMKMISLRSKISSARSVPW